MSSEFGVVSPPGDSAGVHQEVKSFWLECIFQKFNWDLVIQSTNVSQKPVVPRCCLQMNSDIQ